MREQRASIERWREAAADSLARSHRRRLHTNHPLVRKGHRTAAVSVALVLILYGMLVLIASGVLFGK